MAKRPSLTGPENADDFPQVQPPAELFPTTNIRHVITETAKLMERVDNLVRTVDKLADAVERGFERQSAALKGAGETQAAALKDGLATTATDLKERIGEVKTEAKSATDEIIELNRKVSFVRGVMWVLAAMSTVIIVFLTAYARTLFK